MAIDFRRPDNTVSTAPVAEVSNDDMEVKEYNIQTDRQQMEIKLKDSQELDDVVSKIEVYNLESIPSSRHISLRLQS